MTPPDFPIRTAVIVGGTHGIGFALGRELSRLGWRLVLTGSSEDSCRAALAAWQEPGGELTAPMVGVTDLRDPAAARTQLDQLIREAGQIDLFVFAAGVLPPESDWTEVEAAAAGLEINLTAAVVLLTSVAARFEALGRGHLVAIGSIAGDRGRKASPVYNAGKAGLHAFMDGLRHRLHGTGVRVTTVRPGWVSTRMLAEANHASPLTVTPEQAARAIVRAIERRRDITYVGWWWRWVGLILKVMPAGLHKRFAPP